MKVTIIREDQAAYVDGVVIGGLDLSFMDPSIHAVQWKGEQGWIEYADRDDGSKPANETIDDFTAFYPALDAWNNAKAAIEAAQIAATQPAANQPSSNGTQPL